MRTEHPQPRPSNTVRVCAVVALIALTRVAYIPRGIIGFDGPEYINALKLDSTYNVPPPGNIGYVLLGKAASVLFADPVNAFAVVGVLLSCIAAAYIYLFGTLVLSRPLALATSAAAMLSTMAWYHGAIIASYIVWLAALPAIGYYGVRYVRERSGTMLVAAAVATGLATILRPDMVMFGGPLLGGCLIIGKAPPKHWVWAAAICAACCCVWFFGTASLLGGPARYIEWVRAQTRHVESFGAGAKGFVEGLLRNSVKYGVFMLWEAHAALVLAAVGGWGYLRTMRERWRAWALGVLWVGPSFAFSIVLFMGNAGLILPAVPLVFIAAAKGLEVLAGASRPRRAVALMALLGCINAAQFALTPIPALTDQRRALLTHMFFGYSGTGIRRMYTYQLEDFGIDRSLKNTARQFWRPEPLPKIPEGLPERTK